MLKNTILFLFLFLPFAYGADVNPVATEDGIEVYFSPKGQATEAIVKAINGAKTTISIQAYKFHVRANSKGNC